MTGGGGGGGGGERGGKQGVELLHKELILSERRKLLKVRTSFDGLWNEGMEMAK